VSDKTFAPEQYGVAIKKGNADLVAKINKGLADIKSDGSYDKLFASYFGAPPAGAAAAAAPAASK
jgi:polar amino acid transport system substrate-binding protein